MGIILFGGSFNPLHIGHMRLAIEAFECLSSLAGELEFIPTYCPPHKGLSSLLPFPMRVEMIAACLKNLPFMKVNDIEKYGTCPSYTWNLLQKFHKHYRDRELYFLLGSSDYELLPEWYRGVELIKLTNLVIVPRGDFSFFDLVRVSEEYYQGLSAGKIYTKNSKMEIEYIMHPAGNKLLYLPLRFLDISSSYIRKLWIHRKNIDFLVPEQAAIILKNNSNILGKYWQE